MSYKAGRQADDQLKTDKEMNENINRLLISSSSQQITFHSYKAPTDWKQMQTIYLLV